eukprot:6198830-Pleurochrysis_carterae.AAC.2
MAVTRHVLLLVTIAAQVAQAYMGGAASGLSKVSVRTSAPQMAAVPVVTFEGTKDGEANVDLKVAKSGAYIIQRKVVTEQANMRLGTACTKTRSDVRGGGRKPYKQKGTGWPIELSEGAFMCTGRKMTKAKLLRTVYCLLLTCPLCKRCPYMTDPPTCLPFAAKACFKNTAHLLVAFDARPQPRSSGLEPFAAAQGRRRHLWPQA